MRDHRAVNGAGKTTFFNLDQRIFSTDLLWQHRLRRRRDITRLSTHERVTCGMARTFQITEIFPELTVFENVRISAEVAGGYRLRPWIGRSDAAKLHAVVEETLKLVSLEGKAGRLVGELAHGDQRAAEIAMALALKPHLLLLDEPTVAGMGRSRETFQVTQLIRVSRLHRESNYTIVLIEHDMRVVFHLAGPHLRARSGAGCWRKAHRAAGNRRQRERLSGQLLPVWVTPHDPSPDRRRPSTPTTARATSCTASASVRCRGQDHRHCWDATARAKSTTLRSLMGLVLPCPRRQEITVFGQDTTRWPTFRIAALGVGYVPEGAGASFANGTSKCRRESWGSAGTRRPWTIALNSHQLFPRLAERKLNRGRQLSGGEQEMLSIARALLLNPRLLILDELLRKAWRRLSSVKCFVSYSR